MTCVRDIMTAGVEHVDATTSVEEAARRMAQKDIGFLAVSSGQAIRGVLTDRDIVTRCVAERKNPRETPALDCLTSEPATISQDAGIEEAAQMMEQRQIRRLLVADEQGTLVGVCSLGDLATGCRDDHLRSEVVEKVSS